MLSLSRERDEPRPARDPHDLARRVPGDRRRSDRRGLLLGGAGARRAELGDERRGGVRRHVDQLRPRSPSRATSASSGEVAWSPAKARATTTASPSSTRKVSPPLRDTQRSPAPEIAIARPPAAAASLQSSASAARRAAPDSGTTGEPSSSPRSRSSCGPSAALVSATITPSLALIRSTPSRSAGPGDRESAPFERRRRAVAAGRARGHGGAGLRRRNDRAGRGRPQRLAGQHPQAPRRRRERHGRAARAPRAERARALPPVVAPQQVAAARGDEDRAVRQRDRGRRRVDAGAARGERPRVDDEHGPRSPPARSARRGRPPNRAAGSLVSPGSAPALPATT